MKMKIDDLEQKLDRFRIMKFYEHSLFVEDEDKRVVYTGRVPELYYETGFLRFVPELERADIRDGIEKTAWKLKPGYQTIAVFLYGGEAKMPSGRYTPLQTEAAMQGMIITEKLIGLVFSPIDEELLDLYNKILSSDLSGLEIKMIES